MSTIQFKLRDMELTRWLILTVVKGVSGDTWLMVLDKCLFNLQILL